VVWWKRPGMRPPSPAPIAMLLQTSNVQVPSVLGGTFPVTSEVKECAECHCRIESWRVVEIDMDSAQG
jgi:hypothetical protein